MEMKNAKTAVVTGGGTGVGKAVALALAGAGYQVVVAGRRQAPLDETCAEAQAKYGAGERMLGIATDVSDPAAVEQLFARTVQRFGRVDLLFNNAGRGNPPGSFLDWTPEQWREVVDVNLNGMFYCLQQAFRTMRDQSPRGGRIINNGSISSTTPRPNSMAYTATKHGVRGMTKTAALDGRKYDIAVGQIDIGNVASDMTEKMAKGVPQADGTIKAEPRMDMSAVVETFLSMSRLPLSANILFTTVMATNMPFVGRG